MTKQGKIQEEWIKIIGIENYNSVLKNEEFKEDGWRKVKSIPMFSEEIYDVLKYSNTLYSIRPKSLQGIENNNDWIKIESEYDLPKDFCSCWVIINGIVINMAVLFNPFDKTFTDGKVTQTHVLITHYQQITKPQPPLY